MDNNYYEKVASSKKNLKLLQECINHTLQTVLRTKMIKIDTLFMTKTAKKPYPLAGLHIPINSRCMLGYLVMVHLCCQWEEGVIFLNNNI